MARVSMMNRIETDMKRKVRVTVSADFIATAGALRYTFNEKEDAIFADKAFAIAEEQLLAKARDALRSIEGSNFTLTLEEKENGGIRE